MKPIKTLAVVGLGLMGGSLAAACRKSFPFVRIIGISRNPKARKFALQKRWIHESYSSICPEISAADLIILCSPIDTFPSALRELDRMAKPGAVVTDVGSLKKPVQDAVKKIRLKNIRFVGSHPMVGSHECGIEAARADLYRGGAVFVVPSPSRSVVQLVQKFWKKLGMKVRLVNAERHDEAMASISHLPHALAAALVAATSDTDTSFSGPGFKDVTRIAQGHPAIWTPILLENAKNVLKALNRLEAKTKLIKSFLIKNDQRSLSKFLDEARCKRAEISL